MDTDRIKAALEAFESWWRLPSGERTIQAIEPAMRLCIEALSLLCAPSPVGQEAKVIANQAYDLAHGDEDKWEDRVANIASLFQSALDAAVAGERERADKAWATANNALRFDDSHDFRSALYEVCQLLKPEDVEAIGKAYKEVRE